MTLPALTVVFTRMGTSVREGNCLARQASTDPYARIILVYAPTKNVRMMTPAKVCAVLR